MVKPSFKSNKYYCTKIIANKVICVVFIEHFIGGKDITYLKIVKQVHKVFRTSPYS